VRVPVAGHLRLEIGRGCLGLSKIPVRGLCLFLFGLVLGLALHERGGLLILHQWHEDHREDDRHDDRAVDLRGAAGGDEEEAAEREERE
jgi:hypothetical protein